MAQNTEAVRSRFHKVVQDHLCLLDEDMHKAEKEDKTLHELGADSLDIVEIAMEIEEDFDIEIPDEDWNGDRKLSELFNELLGLL